MNKKEIDKLLSRISALEEESKQNLFDTSPAQRPTIVSPMAKVYETSTPLYDWLEGQSLPVVPLSLGRLYKVIDDLGPVFETEGDAGAITPAEQAAGTCANKVQINFGNRDYKAFRVAVEACVEDTDVDVPFIQSRDAQPAEGVGTVGEYRDVKVGEAMRQSKNFLLNQGLGNSQNEPESIETMINQSTTPNIVDNEGQGAFEFALMAVLAQIGLTVRSNSYIRSNGEIVLYTHPLVEFTMSSRASLPGLEEMYELRDGVVYFMGIPVVPDKDVFINSTSYMTSIFVLRNNMLGKIEQYTVDKEHKINEDTEPGAVCDEDCTRLSNYLTGLGRGLSTMGRVINVKPTLVNTIMSGHSNSINQPNAGTLLGGSL